MVHLQEPILNTRAQETVQNRSPALAPVTQARRFASSSRSGLRHEDVQDVLVEHLGEFLAVLKPRTSEQVKSQQ